MRSKRAQRACSDRRASRLRERLTFEGLEPRQMLDGDPDTNFGAGGVLLDATNGSLGVVSNNAKVVIADGNKIVVAATFKDNLAFQLSRYDEHGVLDANFGVAGRAGTAINSAKFNSKVYLDVMEVNGHVKYVLAGTTGSASDNPNSPVMYRFDENGTLDTSFGDSATPGRKEFGGSTQTVAGVAVDSLNRIVVSGWTTSGDAFVSRFLEFGVADPTFDGDGSASAPIGLTSNAQARVTGVAIDAGNRIIVAGNSLDVSNHFLPTMLRFGANGALDATFDGDGRWIDVDNAAGTLPAGTPPEFYFGDPIETVHGPVIDANQNVLFVTESLGGFRMVRLSATGQLDATFGSDAVDDVNGVPTAAAVGRRDGVAAWNPGALAPKALALSLDANGRILVTGSVSTFYLALARFSGDGAIDSTFNGGELVQLNAGGVDAGTDIAVDSLGRVVVVGTQTAIFGGGTYVLAARFNGEIVAPDLPPTASGDSYQVNKNNVLNVATPGVLANDDDPEHQQLTAVRDQDAAHGQVTLNPDGSFSYAPTAGYFGPDSFTYHASDGASSSASVQVSITVLNPQPVGLNDSYQVPVGSTLNVVVNSGILRNDVDVDNDPLTAVLLTAPSHAENGTFALNADGTFTYVHANGFHGTDSFTYRAFDGDAYSSPITVSIVVKTPSDQHPQQAYSVTNISAYAPYSSSGAFIDEQGLHAGATAGAFIGTRPEDGIDYHDIQLVGEYGNAIYFTMPQPHFISDDFPVFIQRDLFIAYRGLPNAYGVYDGRGLGARQVIIPGPGAGGDGKTIFIVYTPYDPYLTHFGIPELVSVTYDLGGVFIGTTPTLIELTHFSAAGPNPHYDLEFSSNFRFTEGRLYFTALSKGDDPQTYPDVFGLWQADYNQVTGLVRQLLIGDNGYTSRVYPFALGTVTVLGGEVYLNNQPIGDIRPGPSGSDPQDFVEFGGSIYFTADDGMHGRELWKTSGGAPQMVRDLSPGPFGSFPPQTNGNVFFEHDGVLYFSAEDPAHGQELWRSDGTESGTYLVRDIRPGSGGSSISTFYSLGSTFVFAANDGVHGTELWRSDGTQAGTRLFFDLNPGGASSFPRQFVQVNGHEQFGATIAFSDRLWTLTEIGNQAPSIVTPLVDQVAVPGASFLATVGSNFATDPDVGDTLEYSAQQSDGSPLPAWLSFDPNTRTFHGQPLVGDVGDYSIEVTVRDRGFLTASDTFQIRVGAQVSQPPVAKPGGPYKIASGSSWYLPRFFDLGSDPDFDVIQSLRWDINNDGTVDYVTDATQPQPTYETIPWSVLAAAGLTETNVPYDVTVSLTVVSKHGSGATAVLETSDPVATTLTVAPRPETAYVGQFFAYFQHNPRNVPFDPDGAGPATLLAYDAFPTLQMAIDAVATGGTVSVASGYYVTSGESAVGVPIGNFGKPLTLEVTPNSGDGQVSIVGANLVLDSAATVRIAVRNGDYDAFHVASRVDLGGAKLVLVGNRALTAQEQIHPITVDPLVSQPDPGLHGVLVGDNGTSAISFGSGHWRIRYAYVSANDFYASSGAYVELQANTPPVVDVDYYFATEDVPFIAGTVAGVLANDFDIDHDVLTATLAAGPQHGLLDFHPDGSFTYNPAGNYFGPDSFAYRVTDGLATSGLVTVTLDVASVADDPTITSDHGSLNLVEGDTASNSGTWGDADLGEQVLLTANFGIVVQHGDGTWTWSAAAGTTMPTAIVVRATDEAGAFAETSFTVSVENVPLTVAIDGLPVGAIDEGASFPLTAVTSGADPDLATYIWYVNGDFAYYAVGSAAFTFTPQDGGNYVIEVDVISPTSADRNEDELAYVVSDPIQVRNVPPVVTLSGLDTALGGSTVDYAFSVGPVTNDDYTLTKLTAGPGGAIVPGSVRFDPQTGAGSFQVAYSVDGLYAKIDVQISDSDGLPSQVASVLVGVVPPAGRLDDSFDADGRLTLPTTFGVSAHQVLPQANGKIVVLSYAGGNIRFPQLVGLNRDGSLDSTFGNSGVIELKFGGSNYVEIDSVIQQSDGKFVVLGYDIGGPQSYVPQLIRLTVNGALDISFGTNGRTALSDGPYQPGKMAVDSSGRIVVAGRISMPGGTGSPSFAGAVVRLSSNGVIDRLFGSSGLATLPQVNGIQGLSLRGNGKVVVTGQNLSVAGEPYFLLQLGNDGQVDSAFSASTNGIIQLAETSVRDPVIQSDGKIVVVGVVRAPGAGSILSASRYGIDGVSDSTFDKTDLVAARLLSSYGHIQVEVQADGKVLVAYDASNGYGLIRLNANGTFDSSFDGDGMVLTAIGSYFDPNSMQVDADGKIVVGGYGYPGGFALARFLGDPVSLPPVNLAGDLGPSVDDTLTIDLRGVGSYSLAGRPAGELRPGSVINFDGGALGVNKLAFVGNNSDAQYVLDPDTPGKGTIFTAQGVRINFVNLTPVDFDNVGTLTIVLPGGDEHLQISEDFNTALTVGGEAVGTVPALKISGTSGGVGFEEAHVFRTQHVVIDTSNVDGDDVITVLGAATAHGNGSLEIRTGAGADLVTFAGAATFADGLTVQSPAVALDADLTAKLVTINSPLMTIGFATQDVQVVGNLIAVGTLLLDVNGVVAGASYDRLRVSGSTDLSGLSVVTTVDGDYMPAAGDVIELLRVGAGIQPLASPAEGAAFNGFAVRYTSTQLTLAAFAANQPNVAAVRLGSTAWSQSFRDLVDSARGAAPGIGYILPVGDAEMDAAPWVNLNQIAITFDRDVHKVGGGPFLPGDIAVHGVSGTYTVSAVSYDAGTHTLLLTLADSLPADKLLVTIDRATLADSDGHSPAEDVAVRFNVLPGDVDRDGIVMGSDVGKARLRQFAAITAGVADANYSIFADLEGSGAILGNDVGAARLRQFTALPPGVPMHSVAALMQPLLASEELVIDEAVADLVPDRHASWLAAIATSTAQVRSARPAYRPHAAVSTLAQRASGARPFELPAVSVIQKHELSSDAASADAESELKAIDEVMSSLWSQ